MANERIQLHMTTAEVVYALSEGNPGAVRVLCELLSQGGTIDPDTAMSGLSSVLALDTLGIYGSRIWLLYKDVCGEDLATVVALLRAWQLGGLARVNKETLNHAIDHDGEGIDIATALSAVRERLPRLAAGMARAGAD